MIVCLAGVARALFRCTLADLLAPIRTVYILTPHSHHCSLETRRSPVDSRDGNYTALWPLSVVCTCRRSSHTGAGLWTATWRLDSGARRTPNLQHNLLCHLLLVHYLSTTLIYLEVRPVHCTTDTTYRLLIHGNDTRKTFQKLHLFHFAHYNLHRTCVEGTWRTMKSTLR